MSASNGASEPRLRRVSLWRLEVLPGSETFIRNQQQALRRWRGTLVGSVAVDSALSDPADRIVFDRSLCGRVLLWLAARSGRSARITQTLRADRPELVHAHFAKDAWMVLRSVRRLDLPLVVTVHGYDVTALPQAAGWRGAVARRRTRAVFRRASRVIAVSEFIRMQAERCGADPRTIVVLPIGIPLPPPQAAARPTWDLLFVGRFVAKKGLFDLIEAIALLPGHELLTIGLVGDGPLLPAVRELAARRGVRVEFLGAAPPERVRALLAATRVFVAPSRTAPDGDAEGFGQVFLEAAAAGVPVVAYAHGGVPESVLDGRTGLLAPEGEVEALAERIARLLADAPLRWRLGEAARRRVRERFEIGACTAALEALYEEVVAERVRSENPASAPSHR